MEPPPLPQEQPANVRAYLKHIIDTKQRRGRRLRGTRVNSIEAAKTITESSRPMVRQAAMMGTVAGGGAFNASLYREDQNNASSKKLLLPSGQDPYATG
jgi:hypothetical protein